ncbi:MAG: isoleucine--tRNA ligase [Calditrichia bacterium]
MFKEVDQKKSIPQLEESILSFWEKHNIFEKSRKIRENAPHFVFYEGPPTANGKPGIHHVLSRTIKDTVCRYKTMAGYRVDRKAGWDTHGLPVEIEVEKQLNLDGKEQIEEYGVERFNQQCKESVFNYKKDWDDLTRRIGYWIDLENPYITFTNDYIESVWWILAQFHKKNLLYQGFKILPYCPRCQTPLSSHEVSQGYKTVKDPSVYVKAQSVDEPEVKFLVWTTTPWTLISNVALAVHPDVDYVEIETESEKLILAEARLSALFKEDEYKVLKRFKGKELEGKRYKRLFDFVPVEQDAFYVVLGDFVTTEDGTGIVHIAPAFGDEDYQVGRKYNLPVLRPVDGNGRFEDVVAPYKKQFVKDADEQIIYDLKQSGILFKKEKIEHSYPHCWRCQTPLLYYARESWYIETTKYKDKMMQLNSQIQWFPPEVGSGRFGEWLKNNIDWSISRDRYWGTPLNVWICDDCEHQHAIESIEELKTKGHNVPEDIDLHKPYVDEITLTCEKCNGTMHRVPEVIDCWFDSGAMPYAQFHYPFENKEKFENKFPADFISEGIDQTRGWFYSLLAISTMLFEKPAYKRVIVNELILDKHGQKMSKSRGNVVVPQEVIDAYGVDALRWYFITSSFPWLPKRFDMDGVAEVYRKFFNTLLNTYSFFTMYANIDGYDPNEKQIPLNDRPEIDRWILSALYKLIGDVKNYLENYDITRAARSIDSFVQDDLSNWYVRRNRRRFWKSGSSSDKLAAYQTLHEVLLQVSIMIAPFAPFISEYLYQNLKFESMAESVHLTDYPQLTDDMQRLRDIELENKMRISQQIVSLVRALRNQKQIKTRQPLSKAIVASTRSEVEEAIHHMADIIKEEVNVKEIELVKDSAGFVTKKAKPDFKKLGPRYGKLMGKIAAVIKNFDDETIASLEAQKETWVNIEGNDIHITLDDVEILIEPAEHYEVVSENNLIIGLDTEITESLKNEGLAREFINRIQNLRKEAGFEVTDHISIGYQADADIVAAVSEFEERIKNETLADDIQKGILTNHDIHKKMDIDNQELILTLKKK